jgi:Spirocyclase AveC-like
MRPTIEAPTTRAMPPTGRKTGAVKVWAAVGAAFLSLEVYVITRWVLSDDFGTIPAGPTPMSGWDRAWSIFWQVGGVALLVGFIGWFVIRPWRREGRLSLDGLLVLCFSLIVWQDPWCNYIKDWGTYNTHLIQFGSWTKQIPGWMSPNGNRFAEPLLVMIPIYVWAVFGMTILGCWALRRVKTQWPQLGTVGLVTVAYGMFVVVDFVLETLWMRTGIWAYPGGGPLYVFFEGSRYQFPIHESLLWGAAWAGFTCLRFFRDDKGYTFAERGIDDVKATAAQKTGLRFLALFGAINVLFLVLYNVPAMLVAAHGQSWSHGVEEVSYMNDYLCGEGTTYACADESTPIPWGHSDHVSPDGQLIPNDAEPPIPVGIN